MSVQTDPNPPPDLSFGALLDWHLTRGTRPTVSDKRGIAWGIKELAGKVGVSDRQVRYWLKHESLPRDAREIEEALFGRNPGDRLDARIELREALKRAREGE